MFFPETYSHKLGTIGTEVGGVDSLNLLVHWEKEIISVELAGSEFYFSISHKTPLDRDVVRIRPRSPNGTDGRIWGGSHFHWHHPSTMAMGHWDRIGKSIDQQEGVGFGIILWTGSGTKLTVMNWLNGLGLTLCYNFFNSSCIIWKKHF